MYRCPVRKVREVFPFTATGEVMKRPETFCTVEIDHLLWMVVMIHDEEKTVTVVNLMDANDKMNLTWDRYDQLRTEQVKCEAVIN